jgi:hypothetical protein
MSLPDTLRGSCKVKDGSPYSSSSDVTSTPQAHAQFGRTECSKAREEGEDAGRHLLHHGGAASSAAAATAKMH